MSCLVVVHQALVQHRGRDQGPVGLMCPLGGDNMVRRVASDDIARAMDA